MYCDFTLWRVRAIIGGGGGLQFVRRSLKRALCMVMGKPTACVKCGNIGSARKYLTGHKHRAE